MHLNNLNAPVLNVLRRLVIPSIEVLLHLLRSRGVTNISLLAGFKPAVHFSTVWRSCPCDGNLGSIMCPVSRFVSEALKRDTSAVYTALSRSFDPPCDCSSRPPTQHLVSDKTVAFDYTVLEYVSYIFIHLFRLSLVRWQKYAGLPNVVPRSILRKM